MQVAVQPPEEDGAIRVMMGPQANYFTPETIYLFLENDFTVSALADRMGFQLTGPRLEHAKGFNIVSDGIVDGHIQVPGSGQPIVLADPREIASAITNLVDNAVKYSDQDDEIWLGIERRADGGLSFACKDEGIGISEADQANLFAPLFRSTNEDALQRPGTGLGLGIVREIMQRHGGSVEVESRLGRGTTLRLHFPAPPHDEFGPPSPRTSSTQAGTRWVAGP